MIGHEQRLRGLVDAGIALTSELSLDAVLGRLVESAAELTGARYAALGVIDRSGRALERFVTTGIDPEVEREIGDLPTGRGILGVLIREAKPLRLEDLSEDPRSVGFPPGHPTMRSFLGVPIALRGVAYGNLYLTEKEGGEFSDEDEEVITILAAQAAVAIENARLYESATRWLRQLESLNEISTALTTELDLGPLLSFIVRRLRELIGARIVLIELPAPGGGLVIQAAEGEGADQLLGLVLDPRRSKGGRVLERRRSERVDSLIDDPEVDQQAARVLGGVTGLYVPLLVRDEAIGVVACHDKVAGDNRYTDEDLRLAETFAARAAIAVDLSERVERNALRRALAAQETERKRLARELHDETGQALTSMLLGLRAVEETPEGDERKAALAALREIVVSTLQDVRRLAVELRPKALDDFGLVPALERLAEGFAEHTGVPVELEARLPGRLSTDIETTLYRIVQEALTNVIKHARARQVSILLTRKDTRVTVVIEDDGLGFSPGAVGEEGIGLVGMRERLLLLGGTLTIESSAGAGTTLVAEVPLS